MLQLSNIINRVYKILPNASIGGKYVHDYINGQLEGVNRMDLVIDSEISDQHLELFRREFGQLIMKIERIIEFDDMRPSHLLVKLRNINSFSVFAITVRKDIINQKFFSVNNFLISPMGEIRKRNRNQNNDINDIAKKRFKTTHDLISISNGIDRRYSYIRMMEFMESILEQESGWTIDHQIHPFFKIKTSKEHLNSTELCAICRDDINDSSAIQLQCDHWYHINCISSHLSGVGPRHEKCPVCRKQII